MTFLILGLLVFLGVHSTRIIAEDWRTAQIGRLGEMTWKALYSVLSLAGLGLLAWGFGQARQAPVVLWSPPAGMRHATELLTLIAFILLVAGYVPRNAIKSAVHHPVALSGGFWAAAHLLSNGKLAGVILFGTFLVWASTCFVAARKRDRLAGTRYPAGSPGATAISVGIGAAAWAGFAFWLHGALIGVRPFG